MLQCTKCPEVFAADESIGSAYNLCQDCWEAECGDSWWDMIDLIVAPIESEA
jgi:hypothetical protein